MNEFITTPTSEDRYNDIVHNFFLWLQRQPQMRKHMNKDNVSTLVFQLGYTLVDGKGGEKFLHPTKTAIQHDHDFPAYWKEFDKSGDVSDIKGFRKPKKKKKA